MADVLDNIKQYLAIGGLFNPELMEHDKVRDTLLDCRDEIERLREVLRKIIKHSDYDDPVRDIAIAALGEEK